jgi:hypothetical protein
MKMEAIFKENLEMTKNVVLEWKNTKIKLYILEITKMI